MNRRHEETMHLPFPDGHDGEAGQLGHGYLRDGSTLMGREDMPSCRAVRGEEFDGLWYWSATTRPLATPSRSPPATSATPQAR